MSSSFIQIMQLQTSKIDEIRAAVDEWQKATEGKRTLGGARSARTGTTRAATQWYCVFRLLRRRHENLALPETDALSKRTMALSDGPPTFVNLDIIEERLV